MKKSINNVISTALNLVFDHVDSKHVQMRPNQLKYAVSGSQWQSVAVSGSQWQSVAVSGSQFQSVAVLISTDR